MGSRSEPALRTPGVAESPSGSGALGSSWGEVEAFEATKEVGGGASVVERVSSHPKRAPTKKSDVPRLTASGPRTSTERGRVSSFFFSTSRQVGQQKGVARKRFREGTLWLASLGALGACASPPPMAARGPAEWADAGYVVAVGPQVSAPMAPVRASKKPESWRASAPRSSQGATPVDVNLPASQCLTELRQLGLEYQSIDVLRGVEVPIRVLGARLGGVEYYAVDGRRLELDCRLALALERLRPVFVARGVERVRFSGAYDYRLTASGRLSHHAHGLAIDIHEVTIGGHRYSVERDFRRGLACQGELPPLNRLACSLEETGAFDEFLTPDHNADHRDHLHVSVARKEFQKRRS